MSVESAYERLSSAMQGAVLVGERMQRHTSYRIGGPCALFITCDTYTDLRACVDILTEERVGWVIVGRGSNVLASDAGYAGAVITLGSEFRKFTIDEDLRMHAGAGSVLQRLVTEAFNKGLSGLEFAVGIPGTLGGAVSMNAGTATVWIGSIVEEVVTYRPQHGLVRYCGSDIGWFYRCCDIPSSEIVLEATIRLEHGDPAEVKQAMEAQLTRRKAVQPLDALSCGSVFRNTPEYRAAELIDSCGLKGYTQGKAQVSKKHANFIVNMGGATSDDVCGVIAHVMEEVRRQRGVELRPEVKFLGFAS